MKTQSNWPAHLPPFGVPDGKMLIPGGGLNAVPDSQDALTLYCGTNEMLSAVGVRPLVSMAVGLEPQAA
jgi:hypothetical protein